MNLEVAFLFRVGACMGSRKLVALWEGSSFYNSSSRKIESDYYELSIDSVTPSLVFSAIASCIAKRIVEEMGEDPGDFEVQALVLTTPESLLLEENPRVEAFRVMVGLSDSISEGLVRRAVESCFRLSVIPQVSLDIVVERGFGRRGRA